MLKQVCKEHDVPSLLVSKLLNAEFEIQGTSRHSKIFGNITKILSEEWRDDLNVIVKDLAKKRKEKEKVM